MGSRDYHRASGMMRVERIDVKVKSVLCASLVVLVSVCGLSGATYSQTGTFALSPTSYRFEISAGSSELCEFRLSNSTAKPLTFLIYTAGLTVGRRGQREFPDIGSAGEFSAAKWVRLLDVKPENVVYSRDTFKFSAEVSVPRGTKPGDYYPVILVEPTEFTSTVEGGSELMIKSRIGAILKIMVPGPISALNIRSSVSEMVVSLPNEEEVVFFRRFIESPEEVVSERNIDDVVRIMTLFGSNFDEATYRILPLDRQKVFMGQIKEYLKGILLEEDGIRVRATFQTHARKTVRAKGEVFVYQKIDTGKGRYLRQLRDRFIFVPAGEQVRGEGTIFPGGMRDFEGIVERPLPPGEYIAEALFHFWIEGDERPRLVSGSTEFAVSEAIAARQKDLLVLHVNPELLEYSMIPGESHIEAIEIENMDLVSTLDVDIFASDPSWIEIPVPSVTIGPGRSKKIRIVVKIPRDAKEVERIGKVGIATTQGKPVYVDIRVKDKRPLQTGK
jgi:hypothetical protein